MTEEEIKDLEERIKAQGYGDLQDGPEEGKPIVSDEDLEELEAAIEQFNEEQARVLISPEQAHAMLNIYEQGTESDVFGFQIDEPHAQWEDKLTGKEMGLLNGVRQYRGWGMPGHNMALLIQKLDKILSGEV